MDENTDTQKMSTKKKKKPKLSKAERKRLRLLTAMRLNKRLMTEQLLRELQITKKSHKQGKIEWEQICKDIKVEEFRKEIQEWSERSERLLEKKDEKINLLIKNIEETHEMNERNFSQHLDHLEYLTKCHQTLCGTVTELHEQQATDLILDFFEHLGRVKEVQDSVKVNSENIMHLTNAFTKNRLEENHSSYMERKFDGVTSEIEIRYSLRDNTARRMKDLQSQLLKWMIGLQGDMVDVHKSERFLHFSQRQRNYVVESKKLNDIERFSRKTISDLQQELLSIESESKRKIYGYKLEQAYFLEARSIIKSSLELNENLTHKKMLAACSESYTIILKLKEFVKYGELLLGLGACCRKYQTEKEKVVPFDNEDNGPVCDLEDLNKIGMDYAKLLGLSEDDVSDQFNLMENFWRRCSNVRFHNILLKNEKLKLIDENEKYRNIIRSMKKSEHAEYILESLQINQLE